MNIEQYTLVFIEYSKLCISRPCCIHRIIVSIDQIVRAQFSLASAAFYLTIRILSQSNSVNLNTLVSRDELQYDRIILFVLNGTKDETVINAQCCLAVTYRAVKSLDV